MSETMGNGKKPAPAPSPAPVLKRGEDICAGLVPVGISGMYCGDDDVVVCDQCNYRGGRPSTVGICPGCVKAWANTR